ncbi:hypothetical protein EYF80_058804 [Liparis tanakae]|uniref:Uncharacterized protein n=1 Tax=Liparis tanakae TaxID=230148 RepID=A0A4Z2EQG2_9TELE|nr:hypothetical protein EYF80_058804 [Liparis tanakae]
MAIPPRAPRREEDSLGACSKRKVLNDDLSADTKLSADRLADKSSKEKISDSDSDGLPADGESRPKQSKFAEAMGKMNPFRSNRKDAEDTETIRDNEKPHPDMKRTSTHGGAEDDPVR